MPMMGFGLDYRTGELLVKPMDMETCVEKIMGTLTRNLENFKAMSRASTQASIFRSEVQHKPKDITDPREVGWTYIINEKDPLRDEISKALRPLAEHRAMKDPESPLIFNGEAEDEWITWIEENLQPPGKSDAPNYIMIMGGPEMIPFRFQSLLDAAASVGRLDFDSIDGLKAYVDKILRLEKAPEPVTDHETLIFAPDGGIRDPTYFSRHYMAEPLADYITKERQFKTKILVGDIATKNNLAKTLLNSKAALVYTASHGLGATGDTLDMQKRINGAICCQHSSSEPYQDWTYTADDVPLDRPFLEGSVFFQFACFGYGTPAESDYSHWFGKPELNCSQDFVAALPKKLLSHPRGPIAFIGHVDTAWLSGFDDPNNPHPGGPWDLRMSPFVSAVNKLLECLPVGLAMDYMNQRYGRGNAQLSNFFDGVQKKKKSVKDSEKWLVDTYIYRSDAQNYMIFGDPAVRLRIPSE